MFVLFSCPMRRKTSNEQQQGPRQEFFNNTCIVDGRSLAGSPCCFYRICLCIDTAVRTVRFIWFETRVLPQGSNGTGQFQDLTGGYAAGISKQDVYRQSCSPSGSVFFFFLSKFLEMTHKITSNMLLCSRCAAALD